MRWLVTVLLVSALTACAAAPNDPYPMPSGSPTMWQNNPARLGEAVRGVMLYITPRAGDRIELLSAEPVGETHGAHVEFWLSRPVPQTDGSLVIGEDLEPLPGAVIQNDSDASGPEHTVGIVAEIEPIEPGHHQLTGVRLRYRLNGGDELVGEGTDVIFTVCGADPAPQSCEV